ncbi:hypothetical protein F5B20DRAFT_575608 [Whalleya microplaca]|nr:hypothetical protein F5B20DRAFT_575608 [Whalleya microplaca]
MSTTSSNGVPEIQPSQPNEEMFMYDAFLAVCRGSPITENEFPFVVAIIDKNTIPDNGDQAQLSNDNRDTSTVGSKALETIRTGGQITAEEAALACEEVMAMLIPRPGTGLGVITAADIVRKVDEANSTTGFQCQGCKQMVSSNTGNGATHHLVYHHPGKVCLTPVDGGYAGVCGSAFASEAQLVSHMDAQHPPKEDETRNKRFECSWFECGNQYKDKSSARRHWLSHQRHEWTTLMAKEE